jgi:capsular exopolysaccharide synthesis family protein
MLVPAVGIVVWDLRKERINSVSDVSKRLKIPVIGTVPLIPVTAMRRLGDATRRSSIWKMRFTESVDGIAARLLRKAECDQTRVVLITSALSGEGKTTLATQLAMSLARSQRKVVLVDFDLRQPTLDRALGLPPGPGICEALRGQGDIMGMVRQSETECLSVVTAGSWNRQVLADLSSGAVATVLEQLRVNFDFVIIDSSPLLPIVDTRLVCQHVDAVVLAVFRDVSQGSKVQAAQEMLDAFGVRSVETVVIGGEEHGNAKTLAYQAARFDEPVAAAANSNVD